MVFQFSVSVDDVTSSEWGHEILSNLGTNTPLREREKQHGRVGVHEANGKEREGERKASIKRSSPARRVLSTRHPLPSSLSFFFVCVCVVRSKLTTEIFYTQLDRPTECRTNHVPGRLSSSSSFQQLGLLISRFHLMFLLISLKTKMADGLRFVGEVLFYD